MDVNYITRAEHDVLRRHVDELAAAVITLGRLVVDMSSPQGTVVPRRGTVTDAVAALLAEHPDMSVEDLVEATGGSLRHVRRVVRELRPR
ncbi:hypothetical protein [Phytohabitans rumicis]|uniref:Uncharacterized protein n=1 Tax=Phytohabitans rumicis TaxID=1076125 RepID=A0A6V8L857_9ACTN|nr:hypothetical protein [Phytohabitans rumicis]GFJ92464.1 hypothetical protein Prum_061060 [Phytohabitans rumicis]